MFGGVRSWTGAKDAQLCFCCPFPGLGHECGEMGWDGWDRDLVLF